MKRKIKKGPEVAALVDDIVEGLMLESDHLDTCGDDLVILTLKGHLLVEHWLESILKRLLSIPELPREDAKLEFNQKLKLVETVVCNRDPGPNADFFCTISKLNSVRNQLAHNLKQPDQIESDVKALIMSYCAKSGSKPDWTRPIPELLRDCLKELRSFLVQTRRHLFEVQPRG